MSVEKVLRKSDEGSVMKKRRKSDDGIAMSLFLSSDEDSSDEKNTSYVSRRDSRVEPAQIEPSQCWASKLNFDHVPDVSSSNVINIKTPQLPDAYLQILKTGLEQKSKLLKPQHQDDVLSCEVLVRFELFEENNTPILDWFLSESGDDVREYHTLVSTFTTTSPADFSAFSAAATAAPFIDSTVHSFEQSN